jgi:2-desacetyl-2-hydroxyethyl bacteriochlorophyllide A dehydrogenase
MHSEAQAVWMLAPRQVVVRSDELPALPADQVCVRARWSAISQGTEMLVYRGQVAPDMALDLPTFQGSFAFPIKYGYALVGVVEAIGDAVTTVAVGDAVFVLHPHQDVCHVPVSLVKKIPATVPLPAAVLAANMETAINIVLDAHPRLGECVVVVGLGIVGMLVAWLLQRHPVQVLAVDVSAYRRQLATQLGVAQVCHPDDVAAFLAGHTHERGADAVIEVSGNPQALARSTAWLAQEGRVVVASWYGTKAVTLDLGSHFHRRRLQLISSQVGHLPAVLGPRWDSERRMQLVWQMLADIPFHEVLTHTFAFTDAAQAYAQLDAAQVPMMQVVFDYASKGDADV